MKSRNYLPAIYLTVLISFFTSVIYPQDFQNKLESLSKITGPNLTSVGNWPYGSAIAIAKDTVRDIVYLGSGGAVLILDVSQLSDPQLISDKINTKGLVLDLSYNPDKEQLYIAAKYKDFQIWDVQDPTTPQMIIQYELPDPYGDPPTNNVDFIGNYAIIDCYYDYVNSIDISDPRNPVWIDTEGLVGNPCDDIHIDADGNLHATGTAYIKSSIQPDGSFSTMYFNPLLGGGDVIFGVTDAAFWQVGGYFTIINTQSYADPIWSSIYVGFAYDIYAQNDHAYLTINDRIQIYNVANYLNPYAEGSLTIPGYPKKLQVIDEFAYVAGGHSGLRNINISNPDDPKEIGFYETFSASYDFRRSGNYGFIAELDDGILVLDLTDLSDPELVGQFNTPGNSYTLEIEDNFAYVADREGGFRIADITDPLNPVEVGFFDEMTAAREVCIYNNYAYVVDDILNEPDWIRVLDISDPANPFETGSILMQSEIEVLEPTGDYLYAAASTEGLRILDISNPSNIYEISQFLAPDVYDVCIQGNYAYLASCDFNGGFITLNITDPVHPEFVSSYIGNGWIYPFDVAIAGDYAYIGDPVNDVFMLLYIGNPPYPSLQGYSVMSGDIVEIYAKDSLVYIADGVAGLHIFRNELYSTPGAGITWEQQASGTSEDLWSVSFVNPTTGWVAGNNGLILKTSDAGENWNQKLTGTNNELFSIFFLNESTGWTAGREGTISKSTDGGESWQLQVTNTTNVFRSIYFVDENKGWAVGQNGTILNTMNGGESWQQQFSGITDYLLEVYFTNENDGWIGTWEEGKILKTTNGGTNWQLVYTPSQASINTVYFTDQNTGWLGTSDVEVFKTTDGGSTWIEQFNNPWSPYDMINDVYFLNSNEGWAVGEYGKIISTTNSGNTWIEETSGVPKYLASICFVTSETGWAVGKDGMILKALPGNVTEFDEGNKNNSNIPTEFTLFDNYPNPFNPSTTISFQIPANSFVSLKIYDVTGTEVETLVSEALEAGKYKYEWDAGKLASGVYFCRLQSGNFTTAKKMILLR